MKKKILILIGILLLILIVPYIFMAIKGGINRDILKNLEGEIYYTRRQDAILTLFKSPASLEKENLVYSHEGRGKSQSGGHNDNIIDFYYDRDEKTINFIAMNNGTWSIFSLKEGEEEADLLGPAKEHSGEGTSFGKRAYLSRESNGREVVNKRGSLYIVENGQERLIKKFYGIADGKFTGYGSLGFSPDGKYLIYSSSEHLTPLGFLIHNMISGFEGNVYILDLETGKTSRFVHAYKIQWIN